MLNFNGFIANVDERPAAVFNAEENILDWLNEDISAPVLAPENVVREKFCAKSPDMFSDDEGGVVFMVNAIATDECSVLATNDCHSDSRDKAESERTQKLLSVVSPQPSMSHYQLHITAMLSSYKANCGNSDSVQTVNHQNSIKERNQLRPRELNEMQGLKVRDSSTYGVHYNRSKYSENLEALHMKLVDK